MKPTTAKALALLRSQRSVTTHDFLMAGIGSRFGARLHELRTEYGFQISEQRLSLPMRGSRYELTFDAELPQPSGERPTGRPGRRDDPCKGVAAPSQPGTDRPPGRGDGSLFDGDAFAERGDWRDVA